MDAAHILVEQGKVLYLGVCSIYPQCADLKQADQPLDFRYTSLGCLCHADLRHGGAQDTYQYLPRQMG